MCARGNKEKTIQTHIHARDEYLFDLSCSLNVEKECHSRKNTSKNMNADYIECVASFHCHLDWYLVEHGEKFGMWYDM